MIRSWLRYAIPSSLALATACMDGLNFGDLSGEGGGNQGFPGTTTPALMFNGIVTSVLTGARLEGVTIRVEAPAAGQSHTTTTSSTGYYLVLGISSPTPSSCQGLTVSFSAVGYRTLTLIEPETDCSAHFNSVDAALEPTP